MILQAKDRQGVLGTIRLDGGRLVGSTRGLQEIADSVAKREGSAAKALAWLDGRYNGYISFARVQEAKLSAAEQPPVSPSPRQPEVVHWKGPGQWRTAAEESQGGEPEDGDADPDVSLAQVRPYLRRERGRTERVGGYHTRRPLAEPDEHGWIPADDWKQGQQVWKQRGEAIWERNEWVRKARLQHITHDLDVHKAAELRPGDRVLLRHPATGRLRPGWVRGVNPEGDEVRVDLEQKRVTPLPYELPPGKPSKRKRPEISEDEARGNSRPVTSEEYQHLAAIGNAMIDRLKRDSSPITGLTENWDAIKDKAWQEVQQDWGGMTIDSHTGNPVSSTADEYAMSVKPAQYKSIRLPESASEQEFKDAMDRAMDTFGPVLQRKSYHLGVFHDNDTGQIDIDPVVVVQTPYEVEAIGAYARSLGGAYHFATGNGYWPPHVDPAAEAGRRLERNVVRLPRGELVHVIQPQVTNDELYALPDEIDLEPAVPEPPPLEVKPLDSGTPTARPVLYTYQRKMIVGLEIDQPAGPGWEASDSAQAAARIRARQPLSAEQLHSLTVKLTLESRKMGITSARRRALLRASDRMFTAISEIRGEKAPFRNEAGFRARRVMARDLTEGDSFAWRDLSGQMYTGTVRGIARTMRGRLTEIDVQIEDGSVEPHVFSGRTITYLLSDRPEDKALPPPGQSQREHIMPEDVRVGDTIEAQDGPRKVLSVRLTAVTSAIVNVEAPPGLRNERSYTSLDGGPVIVRTARGPASQGQPWTSVLPVDSPEDITDPSALLPGDRIEATAGGGNIRYAGTITSDLIPSPGENGKAGGVEVELRADDGDIERIDVIPGGILHVTRLSHDAAALNRLWQAGPEFDRAQRANDIFGNLRSLSKQYVAILADRAQSGAGFDFPADMGEGTFFWNAVRDPVPAGMSDDDVHAMVDRLAGSMTARMNEVTDQFIAESSADWPVQQAAAEILRPAMAQDLTETERTAERQGVNDLVKGLLPQVVTMVRQQVADSMRNAYPRPGESVIDAMHRVLGALEGDPPVLPQAAKTLAAMADQLAKSGAPATAGPQVPLIPVNRPRDLENLPAAIGRMQALLPADPADIGKTYTERYMFQAPTLADLQAGKVPELKPAQVWVPDISNDGGPGEMAMTHNAIIRQAGRLLNAALQERIDARTQGDWAVKRKALEAAKDAAGKAWDEWYKVRTETADKLAKERGYSSAERLRNLADVGAGNAKKDLAAVNAAVDEVAALQYERYRQAQRAADEADHALALAGTSVNSIRREETIKLLQEVRGDTFGGVQLTYQGTTRYTEQHSNPPPRGVQAMRFAESNYPTAWLEYARQHGEAPGYSLVFGVPRGDYTDGSRRIRLSEEKGDVTGDPGSGRVATHEMGHVMEASVPGLISMEAAEVWRRTSHGKIGSRTIDQPKPMNGYTDEYARADKFPIAYSGKDYATGGALVSTDGYELFTTGVESLLAGSPYLDTEFRQWMLGTMALLGRGAAGPVQPAQQQPSAQEQLARALDKQADLAAKGIRKSRGGQLAASTLTHAAGLVRAGRYAAAANSIRDALLMATDERWQLQMQSLYDQASRMGGQGSAKTLGAPAAGTVNAFLHGTPHEYKPGDLIQPHRATDETHGEVTYFTNLPLYAQGMGEYASGQVAKQTGKPQTTHVYEVQPVGTYETDPGSPEMVAGHKSWISRQPLRVVREVSRKESGGQWQDFGAPSPEMPAEGADSLGKYTRPDGTLDPARAKLHQKIISDYLRGHHTQAHPVAVFLGGGPAAGKSSTQAKAAKDIPDLLTVAADDIKPLLPEYQEMAARGDMAAGAYVHNESTSIADKLMDAATARRVNFMLDGTGNSSYDWIAGAVRDLQSKGYQVQARYVTIDTDEAVRRAWKRATDPGPDHGRMVPESVIRAKHARVSAIFDQAMRENLFDTAQLYDNSGTQPRLIAERPDGGQFSALDQQAYRQFLAKASPAPAVTAERLVVRQPTGQGKWVKPDFSEIRKGLAEMSMAPNAWPIYKQIVMDAVAALEEGDDTTAKKHLRLAVGLLKTHPSAGGSSDSAEHELLVTPEDLQKISRSITKVAAAARKASGQEPRRRPSPAHPATPEDTARKLIQDEMEKWPPSISASILDNLNAAVFALDRGDWSSAIMHVIGAKILAEGVGAESSLEVLRDKLEDLKPSDPVINDSSIVDAIIAEWRLSNDRDIAGPLNRAAADWPDDKQAAIDEVQKAIEAARNLGFDGPNGKVRRLIRLQKAMAEAARLATEEDKDAKAMGDLMTRVRDIVAGMFTQGGKDDGFKDAPRLAWNGKQPTVFEDEDQMGVLAAIDWDGQVTVQATAAHQLRQALEGDPSSPITPSQIAAFTVVLHEMIHAVLPGEQSRRWNGDMSEYQKPYMQRIEEGATELGTIQHIGDFLDKLGIGGRMTQVLSADGNGDAIYNQEYAARREILVEDLRNAWHRLMVDQTTRNTANSVNDAIYALQNDDLDEARKSIEVMQHTGRRTDYTEAKRYEAEIDALKKIGSSVHMTAAEYARSRGTPRRIHDGAAWDHYPEQTSDMFLWVQDVASDKLKANDEAEIQRLTDQINAAGSAMKTDVMARQVIEAASAQYPAFRQQLARLTHEQYEDVMMMARGEIEGNWTVLTPLEVLAEAERQAAATATSLLSGQDKTLAETLREHGIGGAQ